MFDVIGALASVVSAAIALIRLMWDLHKDGQQKSNRRSPKD